MKTTRLKVTMSEVQPTVVRVLDVPAVVLLPELHDLLQAAIGWTDSHLHQFVAGDISYGMPDLDGPDDERDESAVALRALPNRFIYLYDFGDGWEHEVVVMDPAVIGRASSRERAHAPPEDVGVPHGYAEFRRVMADPDEPEHEDFRTWARSWNDGFDLDATDLLVRQTVGTVPAPVRLVLGLAADGVRLTPGGRPPRTFGEVQGLYPSWNSLERPASIEEDLPPVAALHVLLRHVGLLRLRKGILGPTRATPTRPPISLPGAWPNNVRPPGPRTPKHGAGSPKPVEGGALAITSVTVELLPRAPTRGRSRNRSPRQRPDRTPEKGGQQMTYPLTL
jgi:hypothetical protein